MSTITVQFKDGAIAKVTGVKSLKDKTQAERFAKLFQTTLAKFEAKERREREKERVRQARNKELYGSPFGPCRHEEGRGKQCGKPAITEWKGGGEEPESDDERLTFCAKHNREFVAESRRNAREMAPTLCSHDIVSLVRRQPGLTLPEVVAKLTSDRYSKALVTRCTRELIEKRRLVRDGANQLSAAAAPPVGFV